MLGIVKHQTTVGVLKRYNCMVFACSKTINLIRMIRQNYTLRQHSKVSQRNIVNVSPSKTMASPTSSPLTPTPKRNPLQPESAASVRIINSSFFITIPLIRVGRNFRVCYLILGILPDMPSVAPCTFVYREMHTVLLTHSLSSS